jgi:hypothetical protein
MIGYTKEQLDKMNDEELKKVSLILRERLKRIKRILNYQKEIDKCKQDLFPEKNVRSRWAVGGYS